jgi:hypothetical protein
MDTLRLIRDALLAVLTFYLVAILGVAILVMGFFCGVDSLAGFL